MRRWQRILMSEPCKIMCANGEIRAAILCQLSAGGARIATAQRLRPGDVLRVDFSIGVAERRGFDAVVVHAVKDERGFQWLAGLCFIDVQHRGDRRIAEFVDEEQQRRRVGFAMPRS